MVQEPVTSMRNNAALAGLIVASAALFAELIGVGLTLLLLTSANASMLSAPVGLLFAVIVFVLAAVATVLAIIGWARCRLGRQLMVFVSVLFIVLSLAAPAFMIWSLVSRATR